MKKILIALLVLPFFGILQAQEKAMPPDSWITTTGMALLKNPDSGS